MKAKWYVSTFIFIFTLLGVINYNQIPEANQEIVLQFTHLKVSENESDNAIAIIKKQLQTIGAENIKVEAQISGGLKITYYSETDAVSVKKILSETNALALENSTSDENPLQLPSNKKESTYNLDVFEIHKPDAESGFCGKCALEIKSDFNRFFISNIFIPNSGIVINTSELIEKEAFKFYSTVAIAIDNTSYKIPEVRAGPNS
ncbi:hypothetical protein ACFQ1R_06050 [Mariniflexile jejuense]|uniref:HMA domain-containing protein n=1 Tax=Mariniflexile jejuense TaxID=1173582 RepID=A0ABW3JHV8_9FLAO